MNPIRFAHCNTVMKGPKSMVGECSDVHAYADKNYVITAWRPTAAELVKINLGEPIYLICCGGMPPVILSTDDPFEKPQPETEKEP